MMELTPRREATRASLVANCRASTISARWGGARFKILVPEVDADAALIVAGRLCGELRQTGTFTVSLGVVAFPAHGEFAEGLLASADAALQSAQHAGRDRAVALQV